MVELMITLVVIGVLAAIALPAYLQYVKRAAYAEVLAQANPVKNALQICLSIEQAVEKCDSWQAIGITPPPSTNALNKVDVDFTTFAITLVPNDYKGIDPADECVLAATNLPSRRTPRAGAGGGSGQESLVWSFDPQSPCVTKGYVTL